MNIQLIKGIERAEDALARGRSTLEAKEAKLERGELNAQQIDGDRSIQALIGGASNKSIDWEERQKVE